MAKHPSWQQTASAMWASRWHSLVAVDRYQAEDLASLVSVEYRSLAAFPSAGAALQAGAERLHPEWTENIAARFTLIDGDADAAYSAAPRHLMRRFRFARQIPLPIETRGCVADFDTIARMLNLWTSTQCHYRVRDNLASILDLGESSIRVIAEDVGGGFGSKSRPYGEEIIVPYASKVLERPVKWIEDRFEHMQATTHSRGVDTEIRVAYDDDGRIDALVERIIVDIGAYVFSSGIVTAEIVAANARGPYRIPNVSVEVLCVGTNKTPLATYRGAGQPEATFPLESVLDIVAKDLDISAAEMRDRNIVRPSDMPYERFPHCNAPAAFDSGDYPEMLATAVTGSGYTEEVIESDRGERTAWGLACGVEGSGLINYESARVAIDGSGHVTVRSGLTSQGQGQATTCAQVCAEALGVGIDDVTVRLGDTDLLSFGRARSPVGVQSSVPTRSPVPHRHCERGSSPWPLQSCKRNRTACSSATGGSDRHKVNRTSPSRKSPARSSRVDLSIPVRPPCRRSLSSTAGAS